MPRLDQRKPRGRPTVTDLEIMCDLTFGSPVYNVSTQPHRLCKCTGTVAGERLWTRFRSAETERMAYNWL